MRIAFYTLGCKVNQYETQVLSQQFAAAGFDLVEPTDIADVYVVNSCTVTSSGDKKTRQILRRLKRQNPAAKVALTGCFPQAFPDAAEAFTEADVITGSYNRASLLPAIRECLATGSRVVNITAHQKGEAFEDMKAGKFFEKTRASIKIEDGCERYCAYCIIPYARGPVRSKPLMDLKLELTELAAAGYKEVVLVGINLSAYGKDFGGHLTDAIALACTTDGIERVRLGSIEPEMITDKDLEEMARYPRLCPQFHLALQSGCDATLKRMNRKYDTAEYRRMVGKIRELFENPAITTDIMVGFPGETEEEFASTLQFVEEIGLAKAHVFSYSIREGTAAARMSGQVDPQVKEERSARLIAATGKTRQEFLQNQVGTVQDVLFETQTGGLTHGYSKNYTPVFVKTDEDVTGAILRVEITGAEADHCIGRIL
ncbi:Threonylcarbamoyladenosine tRNA methylthiotransferase MtaB [uncultured Anaerotruncus sp.]|uniref:Threonylcarbamoyladenosine tRNA methylthiotransferase MtaB n=1 Tax=uncultured Anaerotruncus sp. TaxID=905011 RepID=A0A6N2V720_9FIRM